MERPTRWKIPVWGLWKGPIKWPFCDYLQVLWGWVKTSKQEQKDGMTFCHRKKVGISLIGKR